MIGQFDLYGIFLPSPAALALFAYGLFGVVVSVLGKAGFYRLVWHRPLFNLAVYVTLFGGVSAVARWFPK